MDSVFRSIDSEIVLTIAAIVVALLLVKLLFRIANFSLGTIISIVAIVLILQYVFDISPRQLWFEISHLPQDLARSIQGFS
jgi:multisubunit Na+/H+ antiporter MnhE subunit